MLRRFLWVALLFVAATAGAGERPNILLIMADDIGIEGLGCYGGVSYKTPHLDRLAAEGMRFTHAYAQPLCTPTRVQIMTGKYNHRNWRAFGILDPSETTFGHRMQQAGYVTGIFGKWQLTSYDPPGLPGASNRRGIGMHPKDAGFDEYALYHALETEDKGSRYSNPTMLEGTAGAEGQLKTYTDHYGADVWVDKIVDFFDRHQGEPVFAYYPMALPHWPFQPTPNTPGWDPSEPQQEDLKYARDMIEYMDTAVGKLMQGLQDKGLRDDTIVIFYSDNGTHVDVVSQLADGRQIRGGKATVKQTGIHVPLIVHHPGQIPPSVCDDLVDASDFLPTLLDLAGSPLPDDAAIDGISFAPRLRGESATRRTHAFFWYDSRPGWDKEAFDRHVFALNHHYKLFRDGRLYRLTDRPLQEIPVDPLAMSDQDRAAQQELAAVIRQTMAGTSEPPLVDAYGRPEIDLTSVPESPQATDKLMQQLIDGATEIAYGDPAIAAQRLWIFNPLDLKADELRPCVFFIHGGGWGGSPTSLAAQCAYLQRRGINAVSIHFRAPRGELTPTDTLRDARKAYRWIVRHGHQHGIDVDRMVVSGGSAGGHLSLALSTIALADDPVIEHPPAGYVLFNPVIDLVDGWQAGAKRCRDAGIDPQSFSPAHHVRSGLPPTLILSGSKDPLIPPPLIHSFADSMQAAGNRVEFVEYPGADHGFFNFGRNQNRYFQWTMWEFEEFLQSLGWQL